MVVKIIDTDENGNAVEILGGTEKLKLFGTIPETDPDDQEQEQGDGKQ